MILETATLIFFPGLMVFAAFSDLFTMTISNRVSIALVVIFCGLAYAIQMPLAEFGLHLSCGFAVLICTFTLFAFGWIGGGDAKLCAATALWVGWDHLADYSLLTALLGGGLTLFFLQLRRWPLPQWLYAQQWVARLHDRNNGVPYGIALAIAGLMIYPDTGIWLSAASLPQV
ncbi:A24 family peptidase [Methyloferula stellata]|uniref:A24 family peptidase n=1 Tax=Methyloferula stellata TaxID=876270 RepID=UPI0003A4BA22|nr:prepilin peptidase [Methyloferula stellata]